jgi:hypothetical protein
MFCSADDSISANLTHSVTDSDIIQQLHLEGWHYPRIILGEEIEATQSNTKTIKVLASKLGNGKWQLFP